MAPQDNRAGRGEPGSFTVTSTSDLPDATPGDGRCAATGAAGVCTLRAAIMESNADPDANTVAPTHRPASGSPALDAGNPATPGSGGNACLATDQRGRPRRGRCDIGSFEVTF